MLPSETIPPLDVMSPSEEIPPFDMILPSVFRLPCVVMLPVVLTVVKFAVLAVSVPLTVTVLLTIVPVVMMLPLVLTPLAAIESLMLPHDTCPLPSVVKKSPNSPPGIVKAFASVMVKLPAMIVPLAVTTRALATPAELMITLPLASIVMLPAEFTPITDVVLPP